MSKLHKNTPPISSDVQPPVQLTPTDLQLALRQACLLDYFKSLSPSHRREYIQWLDPTAINVTSLAIYATL